MVVHGEEEADCFKLYSGVAFSATSVQVVVVVAGAVRVVVGVGVVSAVAVEASVEASAVVAILEAVVPEEVGKDELIVQYPFLIVSRES